MKEFNLGDKVNIWDYYAVTMKTGIIVSKRKLKIYHGTLTNYDVQLNNSDVKLIELDGSKLRKI